MVLPVNDITSVLTRREGSLKDHDAKTCRGYPESRPDVTTEHTDICDSARRLENSPIRHGADWLPCAAAAAAALLVYACTLRGTYIYDDVAVVRDDPRVLNPGLWSQLWTRPYFVESVDKLYRPLVSMSFALDHWLHGSRPVWFHLVNIALHMAVAAAVAALGIRLGGRRVGWIAGILFAVHPVHVEAVAGLVGRSESACALATIVGLWLFLKPGTMTLRRIVGIWVCFVAAILSKEQGLLFPALLLAAAPLRRPPVMSRGMRLWFIVAMSWTLAAYLMAREQVAPMEWDRSMLSPYVNPLVLSRGWDRVLMPLVLLGRYAGLLVFPLRLSIDYGGAIIGSRASWHDPFLYLGMIAVLAWVVAAIVAWRTRDWPLLFCLVAMAIAYSMVANIFTLIGTNFAERLMYLPSAFFLPAVGLILRRFRWQAVAPMVGILAVLGAARAFCYARHWNDRLGFYQFCAESGPRSERAYALLWGEYKTRGDWSNARRVAEQARRMVPDRVEAYVMCIECELEDNRFDAADGDVQDGAAHIDRSDILILLKWRDTIARQRAAADKGANAGVK